MKKLRDEFGGGTVKGRRLEEGGRAGIRTDERLSESRRQRVSCRKRENGERKKTRHVRVGFKEIGFRNVLKVEELGGEI